MTKVVELEVKRQLDAIKHKEKLEPHVRAILPDLSSKYLRPMPGSARLYPETDIPLIFLDKKELEGLELPKMPEEIKKELSELGLSKDLVEQMASSPKLPMFFEFVKTYKNLNPNLIATTILVIPKEVKRKLQLPEFELDENILDRLFIGLSGGDKLVPAIVKEAIPEIAEAIAKEKPKSLEELYKIMARYKVLSDAELKKEIAKLRKEYSGPEEKFLGFAIGKLRGKADPQKIMALLKQN